MKSEDLVRFPSPAEQSQNAGTADRQLDHEIVYISDDEQEAGVVAVVCDAT